MAREVVVDLLNGKPQVRVRTAADTPIQPGPPYYKDGGDYGSPDKPDKDLYSQSKGKSTTEKGSTPMDEANLSVRTDPKDHPHKARRIDAAKSTCYYNGEKLKRQSWDSGPDIDEVGCELCGKSVTPSEKVWIGEEGGTTLCDSCGQDQTQYGSEGKRRTAADAPPPQMGEKPPAVADGEEQQSMQKLDNVSDKMNPDDVDDAEDAIEDDAEGDEAGPPQAYANRVQAFFGKLFGVKAPKQSKPVAERVAMLEDQLDALNAREAELAKAIVARRSQTGKRILMEQLARVQARKAIVVRRLVASGLPTPMGDFDEGAYREHDYDKALNSQQGGSSGTAPDAKVMDSGNLAQKERGDYANPATVAERHARRLLAGADDPEKAAQILDHILGQMGMGRSYAEAVKDAERQFGAFARRKRQAADEGKELDEKTKAETDAPDDTVMARRRRQAGDEQYLDDGLCDTCGKDLSTNGSNPSPLGGGKYKICDKCKQTSIDSGKTTEQDWTGWKQQYGRRRQAGEVPPEFKEQQKGEPEEKEAETMPPPPAPTISNRAEQALRRNLAAAGGDPEDAAAIAKGNVDTKATPQFDTKSVSKQGPKTKVTEGQLSPAQLRRRAILKQATGESVETHMDAGVEPVKASPSTQVASDTENARQTLELSKETQGNTVPAGEALLSHAARKLAKQTKEVAWLRKQNQELLKRNRQVTIATRRMESVRIAQKMFDKGMFNRVGPAPEKQREAMRAEIDNMMRMPAEVLAERKRMVEMASSGSRVPRWNTKVAMAREGSVRNPVASGGTGGAGGMDEPLFD
jgi:hypothetical protein